MGGVRHTPYLWVGETDPLSLTPPPPTGGGIDTCSWCTQRGTWRAVHALTGGGGRGGGGAGGWTLTRL